MSALKIPGNGPLPPSVAGAVRRLDRDRDEEKEARVEDAPHATRAAMEEGVVPGGGVELIRALSAIAGPKRANEHRNHGVTIGGAFFPVRYASTRMAGMRLPVAACF